MKLLYSFVVLQCGGFAHGHRGWKALRKNRSHANVPKREHRGVHEFVQRGRQVDTIAEESPLEFWEAHRVALELDTSFSLSVSMSMALPTLPPSPTAPPSPTTPLSPTAAPFATTPPAVSDPPQVKPPFALPTAPPLPSGPTNPPVGTFPPAIGSLPPALGTFSPATVRPTPAPISPSDSGAVPEEEPTGSPSMAGPTVSVSEAGFSDCGLAGNTIELGSPLDNSATPVPLDVSYNVESTSNSTEVFEAELVDNLIRTATLAIFGCNPDTRGRVSPNTEEIADATCEPTVDAGNDCFVLQTTFVVWVKGPVETDASAYGAYLAIEEAMESGAYASAIPTVVDVELVSPRPILDPGSGSPPSEQIDASDLQREVPVSPWTIGFSVASVMGGFVSLLVYARSRKRHRALLDDTTPWVTPENESDAAVL